MDKTAFKSLIRERIIKLLKESQEVQIQDLQTGDIVRIPQNLTSDPFKRGGEEGEVIFIDDDLQSVVVKFDRGVLGIYSLDIFDDPNTRNITPIDEASEDEIENQREFNKELEKTADIRKEMDRESLREENEIKFSKGQIIQYVRNIFESINVLEFLSEDPQYKDEYENSFKSFLRLAPTIKKSLQSWLDDKLMEGKNDKDIQPEQVSLSKEMIKEGGTYSRIAWGDGETAFKASNYPIDSEDHYFEYVKPFLGGVQDMAYQTAADLFAHTAGGSPDDELINEVESQEDEDIYDREDKEPSKAAINKKDSVSTIANKLQKTRSEMKTVLNKWKDTKGEEKAKHLKRLKELTKVKIELEKML